MSEEPLGRLPELLEPLVEAEKRAPDPSALVEARVLGRLGLDAPPPPPPPTSSAATSTGAALAKPMTIAVFVTGTALGVTGTSLYYESQSVPPEPEAPTSLVTPPEPDPEPEDEPDPEQEETTRKVETHSRAAPHKARARPTPHQEQLILERARTALGRGQHRAALAALAEHGQRFPDSQLREERDALTIMALAGADERAKAEQAFARFNKKHPDSIFTRAIRQALRRRP